MPPPPPRLGIRPPSGTSYVRPAASLTSLWPPCMLAGVWERPRFSHTRTVLSLEPFFLWQVNPIFGSFSAKESNDFQISFTSIDNSFQVEILVCLLRIRGSQSISLVSPRLKHISELIEDITPDWKCPLYTQNWFPNINIHFIYGEYFTCGMWESKTAVWTCSYTII